MWYQFYLTNLSVLRLKSNTSLFCVKYLPILCQILSILRVDFAIKVIKHCIYSQKRHRLECWQFYWLVATCQQVATSLLKSRLLQRIICRLVTSCWRNLQQACGYKGFLTINLQQVCWQQAIASHGSAFWYHLVDWVSCKMLTDLLQLVNFWLCILDWTTLY